MPSPSPDARPREQSLPHAPAPDRYTPAVTALLPMLYVGWADRSLTRAELDLIRARMAEQAWLTADEKATLQRLGDPRRPPTRETFDDWGRRIHAAAATLDREDRESLAALGVAMARQSDSPPDAVFARESSRREAMAGLRQLEGLLGPIDRRTRAAVFAEPGDEAAGLTAQYTFDVGAMRRLLDDAFGPLRDEMRALLASPAFAYPTSPVKEHHRDWVRARMRDLAERGYGALALPEAYGGQGDFAAYSAVFEMLGYHDGSLAIKFGVQFGLFAGSIANLGTERHHRDYLTAAGRLALPGCFAMTETGHGSNVRGLETTLTYLADTDELEVHTPHWGAGKEYIGNALDARLATVFGQLIVGGEPRGVHAALVPLRDETGTLMPGVTVEDNGYKIGLNGVDNGRIWFARVRVPRAALLDRFGAIDDAGQYTSPIAQEGKRFFTMLATLVGGRVCVPRAGLSAAKAGLAIAVNYGLRRRQFAVAPTAPETLLLDYPSHQRRLLPVLAKAYALDAALDWLNARYAVRTPATMRELETQAAGLKAYTTWYTTETLQVCREACGGKGYLLDNRIGQRRGDTDIYTTFEGDNTVLSYLVARSLLTTFREEFNAEGAFGILRFVAGRVTSQFTDRSPLAVRNTDPEHLRSEEFLTAAFRFREERMVYAVGQRIRRRIKGGMSSADAFVAVQTHLRDLAMAYVERLVYERFRENNAAVDDPSLREPLALLEALFGLEAIERDRGWFLEYDFVSGAKSKAIRREVERLCAEVRPHAAALVDAFGIPREVLGARIV